MDNVGYNIRTWYVDDLQLMGAAFKDFGGWVSNTKHNMNCCP